MPYNNDEKGKGIVGWSGNYLPCDDVRRLCDRKGCLVWSVLTDAVFIPHDFLILGSMKVSKQ